MTFADSVNDHYYFKDKQDIISIHTAIQHLSHPGGGSDMDIAFSEARRLFSSAEGGRSLVTRVLVIATDADFICKLKYRISSDSVYQICAGSNGYSTRTEDVTTKPFNFPTYFKNRIRN